MEGSEAFAFLIYSPPVIEPLFSVVMPVFLGEYKGAGADRVSKFHRAVGSVMHQTLNHWELIIVVDGCPIAEAEAQRYVGGSQVQVFVIPKQRQWSPEVRNAGLREAHGIYAIYLDADDTFGPDHLLNVGKGLHLADWPIWGALDEQVWDKANERWITRLVMPMLEADKKPGEGRWHAGTQNITHRLDAGVFWPEISYRYPGFGYATEDRAMVKELQGMLGPPTYIPGADHYVMHVPNQYDL